MCNRFRMTADEPVPSATASASPIPSCARYRRPRFPKRRALVVRQHDGTRVLDQMAWGFPTSVPGKRIDKVTGRPVMLQKDVTNVRNYTSPFWRSALASSERRCLVPFTAFTEYGPGPVGQKPLHWFDVPRRPIVSFAGVWRPVEGGAVFPFLTCEPNPLVGPIHPKAMPVLLHEEDEERCLATPVSQALELAVPFPSQLMRVQEGGLDRMRPDENRSSMG